MQPVVRARTRRADTSGASSCEQFRQNGTGNSEEIRSEAKKIVFETDEALGGEQIDLPANEGESGARAVSVACILALDASEVDSVQLPETQEKFFFEGLFRRDGLDLLARRSSLLD